jgi:tetratricopeptide (TPR) repeat protein
MAQSEKNMIRFRQFRSTLLFMIAFMLLSVGAVAHAQSAESALMEQSIAILNGVQTTMVIVILLIVILIGLGGFFLYNRMRQLDRMTQEQRTKMAEIQALYKELQGARKRTENALTMISGKSAELNNTKVEVDVALRQALARMTHAVALLPMGEKQYQAQDYDGALDTYRRAAELDDDNPLSHYRLGYTALQMNEMDLATTHLNRALQIDPSFAPALACLGFLYRRVAEAPDMDDKQRSDVFNEAENYLNAALNTSRRLLDEDGEAYMAILGGIYRRRRQYDQAIRAYQEASEITPFSSYPYASTALVYADKGDYTQMFKNYERVEWRARNEVSARPTHPWGHANLMLSRLALGRDEKLVEEEFTLTFLSMPRDAAFFTSTFIAALRRLEWALASAGQPARAERVSQYVARIERLDSNASTPARSTQLVRASAMAFNPEPPKRITGTGSVPLVSAEPLVPPKRSTQSQEAARLVTSAPVISSTAESASAKKELPKTKKFGEDIDFDFDEIWDEEK